MKLLLILLFIHLIYSIKIKSTYFIKDKGPKLPEPVEFGVPLEPGIAYDYYPGLQRMSLDMPEYIEFIPGFDLAQLELGIGKVLPGNLPASIGSLAILPIKANLIKTKENQEWRFNRK